MAPASEASDYGSILHWEGSILHWEADQLFLGIERRLCNPRVDQQEFFDDVERLAEVLGQLRRPRCENDARRVGGRVLAIWKKGRHPAAATAGRSGKE